MAEARARRRVDPARAAAYDVLLAVREQDAYANLALAETLRAHGLADRDAAFATELAAGTLRRRGTWDAILGACVDRGLHRVQPPVLDVLRLGAHQLFAMRVPAHAAISTSVDLVAARVGRGATGFVNAVLRRASAQELDAWMNQLAPADSRDRAAMVHSHPRWVVDELIDALADRAGEIDDLLVADNAPPAVTLVARPGLAEPDEIDGVPGQWSPWARISSGDPGRVTAVREGRAGVQDEGSQLVVLALAAAPVAQAREGGERWLDLCAGPGGKAALLGALAAQRGAHLTANEPQAHRARLVQRSLAAVPEHSFAVTQQDGRDLVSPDGGWDRVLVDAPCSGLGALRRRPEARWRRTPADLESLLPLQAALLTAALDVTRPGGVVVYATCSPVLAETEGVVRAVLAGRWDSETVDASPVLPGVLDAAGPLPGSIQLWPHRHGTDAMFIALLRRLPSPAGKQRDGAPGRADESAAGER